MHTTCVAGPLFAGPANTSTETPLGKSNIGPPVGHDLPSLVAEVDVRLSSRAQRRHALIGCVCLLIATAMLLPYAAVPWPNIPAFLPTYQTAAIGTCLITAGLMYGHYLTTHSTALLHLSAGYAYVAGVLALQFLSFPGVVIESGRLLGGPSSTIWLWAFWHIGPVISILLFAWAEQNRPLWITTNGRQAVSLTAAALLTALIATGSLVTVWHDELPIVDVKGIYSGSATFSAVALGGAVALAGALALLWRASSFRNLLHVWLGIVAVALICDNALTLFAGSRSAMGWYLGRMIALVAFSVMMIVYLHEVLTAYRRSANLAGALASSNGQLDRDNKQRKLFADELLRADRSKDEFLVMLAHELRGPLAPISYVADLLATGAINENSCRSTSQILHRQLAQMTGLVDDLLDVSRLTRGSVAFHMVVTDAKRVVSDAVEQVSSMIKSKQQLLTVELPDDPVLFSADPARMVQVLTNLLNNAAKYTQQGGSIVLRLEVRGSSVVVTVTDNGIGMTPELVNRAFELFSQGEVTSERSSGGLGIGLALVKSLVEFHGGRVYAQSAGRGRGSKFLVTLPQNLVTEPARAGVEEAA